MFSVPNEVVSAYYTLYFTYTNNTNYFTWNEELMKGERL